MMMMEYNVNPEVVSTPASHPVVIINNNRLSAVINSINASHNNHRDENRHCY